MPMYITNRPCESAGPFRGNLVVSMRPLLPGETCDMSGAPMRQCTNASCYTNGGWCTNAPMHQCTNAQATCHAPPRSHAASQGCTARPCTWARPPRSASPRWNGPTSATRCAEPAG